MSQGKLLRRDKKLKTSLEASVYAYCSYLKYLFGNNCFQNGQTT